jgi:hypothetical protein
MQEKGNKKSVTFKYQVGEVVYVPMVVREIKVVRCDNVHFPYLTKYGLSPASLAYSRYGHIDTLDIVTEEYAEFEILPQDKTPNDIRAEQSDYASVFKKERESLKPFEDEE